MAMTSPFLGSAINLSKLPSTSNGRRGMVMTKASASKVSEIKDNSPEEKSSKRRDLVFAGAAAVVCSIARVAMADEEPKAGTPEAKKKYAPVCITMPTARICRK